MSSVPQPWKLRIQHMLDAIATCRTHVMGLTQEQLGNDLLRLHAVAWNITILGEASRHIPDDIIQGCPEVPWAQIRGMRNHIVHGYDQIDLEIMWNVVENRLPPLVPHLERLLQEPPAPELESTPKTVEESS